MRVQLFDAIDRIAPAYLIGRETGDVMNIAVSDIETLEFSSPTRSDRCSR